MLQDGEVTLGAKVRSPQKTDGTNGQEVLRSVREAIEVRAVVTIRKKMKERIDERIAEQWDSIVHGIGMGIIIQLVSEDVDPGNFSYFNFPCVILLSVRLSGELGN